MIYTVYLAPGSLKALPQCLKSEPLTGRQNQVLNLIAATMKAKRTQIRLDSRLCVHKGLHVLSVLWFPGPLHRDFRGH